MNEFIRVTPFRFWCQKVIPLVYDDSLSYYELLCKVVEKLNEVIDENNKLQDAFIQLKEFVEHYFDSIDFQELVNNKLDEMAEDGTLEAMVNGRVYGDLLHEVVSEDDEELYVKMVLENCAEWLGRDNNADYIASGSVYNEDGEPTFAIDYEQSAGYLGLYANTYDFDTSRYVTVGGIQRHVALMDCTTFMSLLQRNITYKNSPYYKRFKNMEVENSFTETEIYKSGLLPWIDKGGKYPFLTDAYGDITVYQELFLFDKSGNKPIEISRFTNTEGLEIDEEVVKMLKTGDILWVGDNTSARLNNYKYAHHNMLYVKTLDDLNNTVFAQTHNIRFGLSVGKSSEHSEYGYVVHCNSGDDNGLAISTLYQLMNYTGATIRQIYTTRGYISNTGVDSRYNSQALRLLRAGNKTYVQRSFTPDNIMTGMLNHQYGWLEMASVGSYGALPRATYKEDGNDIYDMDYMVTNGHFRYHNITNEQALRWRNTPNWAGNAEIYITGFTHGDQGITQVKDVWEKEGVIGTQYWVLTNGRYVFSRSKISDGTWTSWSPIAMPQICNYVGQRTVQANSYQDVEVELRLPLNESMTYLVFTQKSSTENISVDNFNKIDVQVLNRTNTGFTLRLMNNNDSAVSIAAWYHVVARVY